MSLSPSQLSFNFSVQIPLEHGGHDPYDDIIAWFQDNDLEVGIDWVYGYSSNDRMLDLFFSFVEEYNAIQFKLTFSHPVYER